MRLFTARIIILVPLLVSCNPALDTSDLTLFEQECQSGRRRWVRATQISPDLVPPCNSGSVGVCPSGQYRYIPGSGWCRPKG